MTDGFENGLIRAIIFLIMGSMKLAATVARQTEKLNWKRMFNIFYVNTIAGWGFYSILTAYDKWFDEFPQMVFFIMVTTFLGFNMLNSEKFGNFIRRFFEFFIQK